MVQAQETHCEDDILLDEVSNYAKNLTDSITHDTCVIEEEEEYFVEERIVFQEDWKIGPNPTYGPLNIYGNLEYIKAIELYSITGEMLLWVDDYSNFRYMNISEHPNGIYFIRILDQANELNTFKVIKR